MVGVLWFTVLFVLAVGVANGDGNQNNYLLPGLRMADPGFLPGDWFTWDVVHPHESFSLLIAGIAGTGHLLVGLTVGTVLQSVGLAVASYAVIRALYDRPLLPWAAALALFASLGTKSVASAPLLHPYLEASSLAGVALTAALACLAWRRIVWAGVALGVAGLIHAHFAVLAAPILLAATYTSVTDPDIEAPWRKVGGLWGAYALVALPTLADVVRFAVAPGGEYIGSLSVSLFPWHLAPGTWDREPSLVLCAAVLFGVGGMFLRRPRPRRELAYALGAVAVAVFGSLALGYWRLTDVLVRVWPWRLASFVLLAGLSAGAAAVAVRRRPGPETGQSAALGAGLLLVGVVVIARVGPSPVGHALLALCVVPVARWGEDVVRRRWRWREELSGTFSALVVTLGFLPAVLQGLETSHLDIRPEDPDRTAVYEWARERTPRASVFAVPPGWEDFRLNARRPVVVDWKAVPRAADDLAEWAKRIRAVTGVVDIDRDQARLDSAYATMGCDRVRRLRRRYAARFVVHPRPKQLPCGREVYADSLFRVWELAADQAGSATSVTRSPRR